MFEGIAAAQINPVVGDIAGNAARIRAARESAANAALLVCPELCVSGYPPEDLMLRPGFVRACMQAVQALAEETKTGPAVIIGSPWEQEGWVYNAALLLAQGKIAHIQPKRMLPNYGIFDEKRLFTPGEASRPFRFGSRTLGLMVCEDMWFPHVAEDLGRAVAELVIVINASPFESGKLAHRHSVAAEAARTARAPLLYVNAVGGQDDIVFDGGSFAMDAKGKVVHQLPEFKEVTSALTVHAPAEPLGHEETVWNALKLGLGDYVRKNNFPGVLLGLSGGVDSAIAATLAVDALGRERVLGVLLPSPHTSKESVDDALALAKNLGIRHETVPILDPMKAYESVLSPAMPRAGWFGELAVGGNLQARIRGTALMALSNASGFMLIATSNKSEVATGYTTLYGDSCGGYAPLKDVYKTQVYQLAEWRNAQSAVIPQNTIDRAPTAELAPNQKDQDELPPYPTLDAILVRLVEGRQEPAEIAKAGFDAKVVEKIARMMRNSEYKRRQMPPGVKVSPMLYGRDWRYPLTNRF